MSLWGMPIGPLTWDSRRLTSEVFLSNLIRGFPRICEVAVLDQLKVTIAIRPMHGRFSCVTGFWKVLVIRKGTSERTRPGCERSFMLITTVTEIKLRISLDNDASSVVGVGPTVGCIVDSEHLRSRHALKFISEERASSCSASLRDVCGGQQEAVVGAVAGINGNLTIIRSATGSSREFAYWAANCGCARGRGGLPESRQRRCLGVGLLEWACWAGCVLVRGNLLSCARCHPSTSARIPRVSATPSRWFQGPADCAGPVRCWHPVWGSSSPCWRPDGAGPRGSRARARSNHS